MVYRGGESGTTALFYDFVAHVAPDVFTPWATRNGFPTNTRIIALDSSPSFAPRTMALDGSDQIAQFVASPAGKWSIAYDEFGYARTYGAPVASVQNTAGAWIQPLAANITAALRSATLNADTSQNLSGVYTSTDPAAHPISAYSYLVTQCLHRRAGRRARAPMPFLAPPRHSRNGSATSPAMDRSTWRKSAVQPCHRTSHKEWRTRSAGSKASHPSTSPRPRARTRHSNPDREGTFPTQSPLQVRSSAGGAARIVSATRLA